MNDLIWRLRMTENLLDLIREVMELTIIVQELATRLEALDGKP